MQVVFVCTRGVWHLWCTLNQRGLAPVVHFAPLALSTFGILRTTGAIHHDSLYGSLNELLSPTIRLNTGAPSFESCESTV